MLKPLYELGISFSTRSEWICSLPRTSLDCDSARTAGMNAASAAPDFRTLRRSITLHGTASGASLTARMSERGLRSAHGCAEHRGSCFVHSHELHADAIAIFRNFGAVANAANQMQF